MSCHIQYHILKIFVSYSIIVITFYYTKDNYFFTDINAYPHIVEHSSFSKSLCHLGYEKFDIVPIIIGNSIYNDIMKKK